MELSREWFEDHEAEGFDLRSDYSGCGMFGRTCLGIVGSTEDLVRFILHIANPDAEWHVTDNRWLIDVREDSMGRNTIFYWPKTTVKKKEDDNDAA